MKNFIQDGKIIDYTVATTAIKSGDIRMLEDLAAVAVTDGAIDDTIAMNVTGVYELPKATSNTIKQGQKVYVDTTTGNITTTATNNKPAGTAWEAAAAAATTALVKLNA